MRRSCVLLAAMFASIAVLAGQGLPAGAHNGNPACNPNLPWDRPEGLLIVQEDDTTQYLIRDCGKWPIATWNDLVSHHFDGSAVTVSAQEVAGLGTGPTLRAREGTLYRENGDTAVWIIDETGPGAYRKRFITGGAWNAFFTPCGYGDGSITQVPAGFMNTYYPTRGPDVTGSGYRPDGQVIQEPSGGPYLIEGGEVTGFPNKRKFATYNAFYTYNFTYPVCGLSYDTAYPRVYPDLRAREGTRFKSSTSGTQYLIEKVGNDYYKRPLFYNSLVFYGINGTLRTWSDAEVNGYGNFDHIHPVKGLFSQTWTKNLITSDLGASAQYFPPAVPGSWDTQIGLAEGAWNNAPIWPDFYNTGRPADVHIDVADYGDVPWGGQVVFDPASGNVQHATVMINRRVAPSSPLVAHELGHVLLLTHDGLNPDANGDGLEELDGRCGNQPTGVYRVPQTVMDYDCYLSFGITGPVDWDSCGVNHKFQSGGIWSGC